MRNNSIFGDGKCGVEHSAYFLQSYITSFQEKDLIHENHGNKGKKPLLNMSKGEPNQEIKPVERWTKPGDGWTKLNVDASFSVQEIGRAHV